MTLVPVDGVVGLIAKAEQTDPEGARELLRIGLYETLGGLIDYYRTDLDNAASKLIAKRHAAAMDVLVRRYVEKRDAGLDTSEEEQAAAALDEVSKAIGDFWRSEPRRPAGSHDGGRWVKGGSFRKPVDQMNLWANGDDEHSAHQEKTVQAMKDYQNAPGGFERLKAVGSGLKAVSGPGSAASSVGTAAEVVAALGPEAQKILKPGIQRAAYRYRGTERAPDLNLRTWVRDAYDQKNVLGRGLANASGLSIDQRKISAADNAATLYLMDRLPDPHLLPLSQHANAQPPSEGVIIDADGDAVVQAVGYNGDHYLPFDLKNLRRLSGGSYVRTRAIGGPTSEDIYTALLSNARQVQVVSNSGVFTLEFDPDLRGGRRYSDKARQMVDRYSRLLQAVDSNEIYQRPLDPRDKRRIEHEAYDIYRSTTSPQAKEYIDQQTTEAVFSARRKAADDDALYEAAAREVLGSKYGISQANYTTAQVRAIEDAYHEKRKEALQGAPERYKLNGEGYDAAMQALKQQFPYYIRRAEYRPLQKWVQERGLADPTKPPRRSHTGQDTGFVPRGENVARSLQQAGEKRKPTETEGAPTSTDKPRPGSGGSGAYADENLKMMAPRRPLPEGQSFQAALEESEGSVGRQLTNVFNRMAGPIQTWQPERMITPNMTEKDVAGLMGADWLKYLWQEHKASPSAITEYLMSKEGRDELDRTAHGITDMNRVLSIWEHSEDSQLQALAQRSREQMDSDQMERAAEFVGGLAAVAQPFRKFPTGGDWVLTSADEDDPRPLAMPFFKDAETNPKAYDEYLKYQPDVAKVVEEIDGMDDHEIGSMINETIDGLKATKKWGENLDANKPTKPPGVPAGVTEAEARKTAYDTKMSPLYKRLRHLQVAWFVNKGQFAAAELDQMVEGVGVSPPGKAPAPPGRRALGASPEEGEVSMRLQPRVIVHRSGSPVAKAYARQVAKQRQHGRLVAI